MNNQMILDEVIESKMTESQKMKFVQLIIDLNEKADGFYNQLHIFNHDDEIEYIEVTFIDGWAVRFKLFEFEYALLETDYQAVFNDCMEQMS